MKLRQNIKTRGTVLMEFLFCIPLIAVIFLAIFMLGNLMRDQQRLVTADRYVTWRQLHNNQARVDANNRAYYQFGEPNEQTERQNFINEYLARNYVNLDGENLYDTLKPRFFSQNIVDNLSSRRMHSPETVLDQLTEAANEADENTGKVCSRIVDYWPRGACYRVTADFEKAGSLARKLGQQARGHQTRVEGNQMIFRRRASRDGLLWRRGQSSYREILRDEFLQEMHQAVEAISIPQLKQNLQGLYLERW